VSDHRSARLSIDTSHQKRDTTMTALPQTNTPTADTPAFHEIVSRYELPALLALALDRLLPHNRDTSPTEMIVEARQHLAFWLLQFERGKIGDYCADPEDASDWMAPADIMDLYEFESDHVRDAAELILDSAVFLPEEGGGVGTQIANAISHLEEAIQEAEENG